MEKNCIVCNSNKRKVLYQLFDDRYGYPELYHLNKCLECGHIFLQCRMSDDELIELYTQYYPRSSFDLSLFQPYVKETGFLPWLNGNSSAAYYWIPRNVRVLDVGCGLGQSLAYHEQRGCEAYGVEADHNIKRIADKFGFDVHVGLFDSDVYPADFFDYITMHQVLEHFVDPVKALQGVKKILKPKGTVILTLPNANGCGATVFGKRWINWHAPYHLQFFSRKSMKIAAKKSGLIIERIKTITSSEWLYYQWIHLSVYPEVGKKSVFWDPLSKPSDLEQKKLNRITKIHRKTKMNHLMTRFFDSMGIGDNILYFLKNE
ncbi:MAG: class I SAM-dependent methyltransferase [Candidatus Electrothrix sp. GM3_4]|nr:class I SAM-dependent methyltransferase [Candidatus Electrothrix sp. GM3_4]